MKVRLNFDFYIFFHDFKKGVTICFHYLCMFIFKLIKSFFHYLNYYVFFVPYLILQHKTMRLNYMFIFFWLGKKGVTNPDWKFKIFNVKEDNNQQTSQIWLVFNGIHPGFIALPPQCLFSFWKSVYFDAMFRTAFTAFNTTTAHDFRIWKLCQP